MPNKLELWFFFISRARCSLGVCVFIPLMLTVNIHSLCPNLYESCMLIASKKLIFHTRARKKNEAKMWKQSASSGERYKWIVQITNASFFFTLVSQATRWFYQVFSPQASCLSEQVKIWKSNAPKFHWNTRKTARVERETARTWTANWRARP